MPWVQPSKNQITKNKKTNKQTKKTTFKIAQKKIKSLGINLTKDMKHSDAENYKTLIKAIKEDSKKLRYPMLLHWKN